MLARAEVQDIEGKYRHIWVIFAILEDYFSFKLGSAVFIEK